jgi:hypothetical protein
MTGYWDASKLDILMQWHMAMGMALAIAMVMVTSERKPPSILPSQDEAHAMIGDFTEISVSNSDNDLHLVQATSARFDGQMPDIPEVEIWRTVLLWMFLLSLLSLYFFTSVDLGPVQMASARVFPTSGDKSSGGGVPHAPDPPNGYHIVLLDCGTKGFVLLCTLNGCLIVSFTFLLLYGFMQPRGSAPKEGDNVMAQLHVTCPRLGNTCFI